VTYTASVNACVSQDELITNQALIQDHLGITQERSAQVGILNQGPSIPILLSPADGALDQPQQLNLSWTASSDLNCDPLTYDVFFGTANPPPLSVEGLTGPSYAVADLLPHSTYYWSVSVSDGITQSQTTIWQFTTLNHAPDSPVPQYPADGATDMPADLVLSWTGSDLDEDALTYTLIYWVDGTEPVTVTNLSEAQFDPGGLQPGMTYSWMVIASDGMDTTTGEVWSFSTQAEPVSNLFFYLPLARKTSSQLP
jgi:hypothetical protein